MRFQIEQIDNLNIINMEGTNYIDHRFPCKDMIGQILVIGGSLIAALDINGDLLYLVIRDKIPQSDCTIRI